VTRIGDDFDASFLSTRVAPFGLKVIPDGNTTTCITTYYSETDLTDRNMELIGGVSTDVVPEDIPTPWLTSATYIHITLMPPQQQYPFITFLRKHAPQTKLSIDSDVYVLRTPESIKLVERNFALVDTIFANRVEYGILKDVIHRAPEAVVKLDEDGAIYLRSGKMQAKARARKVTPIDVTGAGDIFAGTFLACRTKGETVQESLTHATNAATDSVTQQGVMHLFPHSG
jgi:sugar/nucleoside kinase (ribokinase family)